MIEPVTAKTVTHWADLASQLWSPEPQDLVADFLAGRFPYEFLFWDNGRAVAFISLSIRKDYVEGAKGSPVAFLEGVFVLPSYRRQGLARKLVTFAREWAKGQGLSQIASNYALDNQASHFCHQALGFQEVSRTVNVIQDC
ncbi:GNAT family N-acetyltransferase [Streptococcus entericus]|uniref:GNAT family N-acetyltransferase n=1 Tax=Streptococcus entericus TaxID=155680 RepID=UPI00035E3284|nr:GNAT family N-acetyltransferase [Streptococcus entericus]